METAGNVPWEWFERLSALVDLFLFDVKHADQEQHRSATGAGVSFIQANLERLLRRDAQVWVRIPVILRPDDDDPALQDEIIARTEF